MAPALRGYATKLYIRKSSIPNIIEVYVHVHGAYQKLRDMHLRCWRLLGGSDLPGTCTAPIEHVHLL